MKVLVIGGGILGTMHARLAIHAGHQVVHIERDMYPRSASVRNFGLIWVSGRKSGEELNVSLRARDLWDEIKREIPELTFRANGSLTLATNDYELKVMEQCLNKPDASIRQWKILDRSETQKINSALQGKFLASLWCPLDATVEPHLILKEVRNSLLQSSNYIFRNNVDIIDVTSSSEKAIAVARNGEIFESDLVVLCPGADHSTLFKDQFDTAPVRRVRLQMMSTEPFTQQLSTSIADGDSLRYYPAYDVPALRELPEQTSIAKQKNMQLLMVQRLDGTLTIGDTHEFDEPFEFKLEEEPYTYLHEVASELIGSRLPAINKRWDGIYSQRIDGAVCDRRQIASNIVSVTGPGGRGNTLAPAIAETTMKAFL